MLISFFIITLTYLILIIVPVFRGSVTEFSKYVLSSTVFGLTAIWCLRLLFNNNYTNINLYKLIPITLFVLICILQILPLPDTLSEILSAKSYELWDSSRNLLNDLNHNYARNYFTISVYPYTTLTSLILLISYFTFGFIISEFFQSRTKILLLIIPIILLTVTEGFIGIYQSLVIYGITDDQGSHGTFVNRNHYAGFMELGTPLIAGLVFAFSRNPNFSGKNSIINIINAENLFKQLILIIVFPLLILAMLMSKSRMGIISLFLSIGFLYFNLVRAGYKLRNTKWIILFFILTLIFLSLYIGIRPVLERFQNIGYDHRIYVWRDCINIIKDFPIFGTGLGTFEYIYPLYKYNVTKAVDYNFAHNDYLQLIIETGILGFISIFSALILFVRDTSHFLSSNLNNNDNFRYFITLGAFTGVLSILIHSLADFNLHIPSNAIYFATLIGIIYAANSKNYNTTDKNALHKSSKRRKSGRFIKKGDSN